jgi:hypothetical protein
MDQSPKHGALHVIRIRKSVEATSQTKAGCQAVIVGTSGGNEPDEGRMSSCDWLENAVQAVHIAPSHIDFIITTTCIVLYPSTGGISRTASMQGQQSNRRRCPSADALSQLFVMST